MSRKQSIFFGGTCCSAEASECNENNGFELEITAFAMLAPLLDRAIDFMENGNECKRIFMIALMESGTAAHKN
jgi:hypothetical protein